MTKTELINGKHVEKRADGSIKVSTFNHEPSRTQQQFKDQVDVNKIMSKFKKTGVINHLNSKSGVYSDLHEIPDLASALNTVAKAQTAFMELPSELRKKFGNDPENLIKYLQDDKNIAESVELGLRIATKPEPSMAQQVAEAIKSTQEIK